MTSPNNTSIRGTSTKAWAFEGHFVFKSSHLVSLVILTVWKALCTCCLSIWSHLAFLPGLDWALGFGSMIMAVHVKLDCLSWVIVSKFTHCQVTVGKYHYLLPSLKEWGVLFCIRNSLRILLMWYLSAWPLIYLFISFLLMWIYILVAIDIIKDVYWIYSFF